MSYFSDFDETFRDLSKIMRKLRDMSDLEKEISDGEIKGKWNIRPIGEPEVKGYVIRWQFGPERPFEPPNPFEPSPLRRPPAPERPLGISGYALQETYEPLVDIFDGESEVKIYVELPSEGKDDIKLNLVEGKVEIKTKNFYKIIEVPKNVDIEKASSKHKNRVLEVTIPKKKETFEASPQRIRIE